MEGGKKGVSGTGNSGRKVGGNGEREEIDEGGKRNLKYSFEKKLQIAM